MVFVFNICSSLLMLSYSRVILIVGKPFTVNRNCRCHGYLLMYLFLVLQTYNLILYIILLAIVKVTKKFMELKCIKIYTQRKENYNRTILLPTFLE